MAVGGDRSSWDPLFPEGLIPEVLQLIIDGWEEMAPVAANSTENPITLQLCAVLIKLKRLRGLMFAIRPESSVIDIESRKILGRIDLEFTHGDSEDHYFAFECKRLYYSDSKGMVQAEFSKYTGDGGMMCYITQKYSKGLPHGGMIGYVLNGDLAGAKVGVKKSMEKNRAKLNLKVNSSLSKSSHFPSDKRLAESVHDVSGTEMTIYHIFLAN